MSSALERGLLMFPGQAASRQRQDPSPKALEEVEAHSPTSCELRCQQVPVPPPSQRQLRVGG